jgi:hypothetical protein
MLTLTEQRITREKATSIVRNIERDFAEDVDRVRLTLTEDWTGDDAAFLRVLLKDDAGKMPRFASVTERLRHSVREQFHAAELDLIPYINFRTVSEQAALKDPLWD